MAILNSIDAASGKFTVSSGGAVGFVNATFTFDAGSKSALKSALAIAIGDVASLQDALDAKVSAAAVAAAYQPLHASLTAMAANTGSVNLSGLTLTLPAVFVRADGSYADPAWITSLAASKLTGVIDVARLPFFASGVQVVSASASIAALSAPEQAAITTAGAVVTTTDGRRWTWNGTGSKTLEASYVELADVTPAWAVISGKPTTLVGYGITDAQGLHVNLTAFAGLTLANDRGIYATGAGALAVFVLTAAGRALLDDADAAAQRTTLGLSAELMKVGVHGANIASASTIDLESATGELVDITGGVTINAITLSDGHMRRVRFTGSPQLSHSSSLVCPTGSNIGANAGDTALIVGYPSGVVRILDYQKVDGTPLAGGGGGGGVGITWEHKAGDFTAVEGKGYQVNTTSSVVQMTLPASPTEMVQIPLEDAAFSWGTYNCVILRNGHNINGVADDYTGVISGTKLTCTYMAGYGYSIK